MTTLECRRSRADLIEVLKILNDFEDIDESLFLRGMYQILEDIL